MIEVSTRQAARDHARLAQQLRHLRARAGMGVVEAGRRAGMSQSKISRLENSRTRPYESDVQLLCGIYSATPQERDELIRLASSVRDVSSRARVVLPRGAARLQDMLSRLDGTATLVRSFSPAMVLGNLQTRAYMSWVFATELDGNDLEAAVNARVRRQFVLDDESKQFTLVMTEGALRWQLGGPDVMIEQIEAIARASRRPNVALGVLPWTTPVRTFCTHSFDIHDSSAVLVGTEIESVPFVESADIAQYEQAFAQLAAAASFDDDARKELARIAAEYRMLT